MIPCMTCLTGIVRLGRFSIIFAARMTTGQAFPQVAGRENPQETGQAFPQVAGREIPQETVQAFPRFAGREIPQETGQVFPQVTGRENPQETVQTFPGLQVEMKAAKISGQLSIPARSQGKGRGVLAG